jgi:hypothetical protein
MMANNERIEAMTARGVGDLGICSTCNQMDICTSRATWIGPVHHCEEFDDSGHGSKQQKMKAATHRPAAEVARSATGSARRGLCVNCLHRDDCALPVAEGGIWHCEEYE